MWARIAFLFVALSSVPLARAHESHACAHHLTHVAPESLDQLFHRAQAKLSEVRKLTGEGRYFQQIVAAAEAALTKHHALYRSEAIGGLDVARHRKVLEAIAGFDSNQPKFSAYKIKRVIEGRHALSEYIHCR